VNAIAVALSRTDPRQVAVPVERSPLGEREPLLVALGIEQAQLD
jgi:hypothetical protein